MHNKRHARQEDRKGKNTLQGNALPQFKSEERERHFGQGLGAGIRFSQDVQYYFSMRGCVCVWPSICTQVCALQWSRHEREILSSHGYSKNQLCLWKYPSLVKVSIVGSGPQINGQGGTSLS
jgi:hypothetical protein